MTRKMILITVLAVGVLSGHDDCQRPLADLDSVYKTGGVSQLVGYAAQVEAWHRYDTPLCYATLSLAMANLFAEHGRSDDHMRQLEQHYAELGLAVADSLPITLEVYLVEHMKEKPVVTTGHEEVCWHRASLWAQAWHRIEAETIADFDFHKQLYINVPLPAGVSGAAGMAPGHIRDPQKRALYEAAIAENKKNIEISNTQLTLKRITPKFIAELEHFFVESFNSSQIGPVVGLFAPIHNPEKERIIQRIAERSRTTPQ